MTESFHKIYDALKAIEGNPDQKSYDVCEGIRLKLERLKTASKLVFWGFILVHMNKTNTNLQSVNINICTVIVMYDSVIYTISAERENYDKKNSHG